MQDSRYDDTAAVGPASPLTRRSLLRGTATAAAAVPLAALLPVDRAHAGAAMTRSTFAPTKGQVFALRGRFVGTKLKLVSVEDLHPSDAGHPRRFSLTFRLVSGRRLRQGTYTVTHRTIGTFSLFVAPVGRSGDIQAVFNAR